MKGKENPYMTHYGLIKTAHNKGSDQSVLRADRSKPALFVWCLIFHHNNTYLYFILDPN